MFPNGTADESCNCIWMPYLDGASFTGYRALPWPVPGSKTDERLWFRGIKNLDATLAWALDHGLSEASEVVVTAQGALNSWQLASGIACRV